MNLLALGGESLRNQAWIHEVGEALQPMFEKVTVHDYAHWASGQSRIDLNHELNAVATAARELGEYIIFAKSAGSILSIKGIAKKDLRPRACLFVGLPLGMVKQLDGQVEGWLKALDVPVIFVQNSDDPHGSFQAVSTFLQEHMRSSNFRLVETPGDTHDYNDLPKVKELISDIMHLGS
jgi:predicted alpha/beta-hydrolase family hydrolase